MNNTAPHNSRPLAVKLALIFLLFDSGAGTISEILYGPWDLRFFYFIFGFGLVLGFVPLWFVYRRKNWARWFVVIFTFFAVCFDSIFWGNHFHLTYSTFQWVWFVSSDILEVATVVLLLLPPSNRWFREHKLSQNTALKPTPTAP